MKISNRGAKMDIHRAMEQTGFAASSGGGLFTAIMAFFNTNAAGIGAICTVISLCIYAYVSLFKRRKK